MTKKRKVDKPDIFKFLSTIVLVFISVFIISTCFADSSANIPDATGIFYVNDYAEIFNDSQKQEMLKRAVDLAYKPEGVQVVVSTVKTLNSLSVEDYANMMYNKYKIGRDDKGILILLSVQERKVRVEVGYGLESVITDSKAGNYIREYGLSYLKNNQFDLGLIAIQKAIVSDLDAYYEKARATQVPKEQSADVPVKNVEPVTRTIVDSSNQENATVKNSENGFINWMAYISSVCALFMTILFGIQTYKFRRSEKNREYESNEYDKKLQSKDCTITSLEMNNSKKDRIIDEIKSNYDKLSHKYGHLNDRYERARKLHEGLDKEIDKMIQKEIDEKNRDVASTFDSKYGYLATKKLLEECISKDFDCYAYFEKMYNLAFLEYDSLSKDQRKYVTLDMDEVNRHYKEGIALKSKKDAESFNKSLESCVRQKRGTEENLPVFDKLHYKYDKMDEYTKSLVDTTLITSLNKLISSGNRERDDRLERERIRRKREEEERRRREEEEEEERRRRHEQDSYSSSFSDSSSFSGFGGSSGGGGASSSF